MGGGAARFSGACGGTEIVPDLGAELIPQVEMKPGLYTACRLVSELYASLRDGQ